MTCDKAMKIIEDDNARKCEKKQEASKNQAEVEELHREIEEKNKMLLKIKENLAGDMESVRKACNRKFHKKKDFNYRSALDSHVFQYKEPDIKDKK